MISDRLSAAEPNRILVHGHRGARARLPENTLPAFEYAIKAGVDALEIDLQVTKDNILVVSHDPLLHPPVCTGPQPSAVLHQFTLAHVRRMGLWGRHESGVPRSEAGPGHADPDFRRSARSRVPRQVRFQRRDEERPRRIRSTCRRRTSSRRWCWRQGPGTQARGPGNDSVVRLADAGGAMRKIAPEIRLSALTDKDKRDYTEISKDAGNARDPVARSFSLVTPEKVAAAHAAGLQVVPWTPNTPPNCGTR